MGGCWCAFFLVLPPGKCIFLGSYLFFFKSEPYVFTHLLIISRVYHLSEEEESALANTSLTRRTRGQPETNGKSVKKHKKTRSQEDGQQTGIPRQKDGIYSYHPEDEVIAEVTFQRFLSRFTYVTQRHSLQSAPWLILTSLPFLLLLKKRALGTRLDLTLEDDCFWLKVAEKDCGRLGRKWKSVLEQVE